MSVGVLFEIRVGDTLPGETLCVTGDRPELGRWDAQIATEAASLRLSTSTLVYPRWLARGPIWFDVGEPEVVGQTFSFEFKFVKTRHGQRFHWEDAVPNRRVELPCEDGRIWILSIPKWNSDERDVQVTRAMTDELRLWHMILDPQRFPRTHHAVLEPPPCAINSPRSKSQQLRWRRDFGNIEEQYRALSPDRALPLLGFWAAKEGGELARAALAVGPTRPRAKSLNPPMVTQRSKRGGSVTKSAMYGKDRSKRLGFTPPLRGKHVDMRSPLELALAPHAVADAGDEEEGEPGEAAEIVDALQEENAMLRGQLEQLKAAIARSAPPSPATQGVSRRSPQVTPQKLVAPRCLNFVTEQGAPEPECVVEPLGPMSGEEADDDSWESSDSDVPTLLELPKGFVSVDAA